MEFKYSDNLTQIKASLHNRRAQAADPAPVLISNSAPYARAIDRGHVYRYTRKRPRSRRTMGVIRLPKGGSSFRSRFRTTVRQPAQRIIGRTKPQVKSYGRFHIRSHHPTSKTAMNRILKHLANYTLRRLQKNTPYVSGFLRSKWRIHP